MIKPLNELRRVDERAQRFTPFGLGLDRMLTPESAAEYQQSVVAQFELAPAVAEGTRRSFDRLRAIYAYGVLCYDIYTLVNDHALLVLEQALRDRFIDFYEGTATFLDLSTNEEIPVPAERFEQVHEFITKQRRRRRNVRLRVDDGPLTVDFNGTLSGLRKWAREAGLLRGQRNRGVERAIATLRNFVAHPTAPRTLAPVSAARTLSDLAEIINHLWGVSTPGGRLYPSPVPREIVVVAWDGARSSQVFLADQLGDGQDPTGDGWRCILVRATFKPGTYPCDPDLCHFDSRYETTQLPTDYLWGPGSITEAANWYAEHRPQPDTSDHLDRLFAVRYDMGRLYRPMRPSVAASAAADRSGRWDLVRADFPQDALLHVHNKIGRLGCSEIGECPNCHAQTLAAGDFDELLPLLDAERAQTAQGSVDFHLPEAYPRWQPLEFFHRNDAVLDGVGGELGTRDDTKRPKQVL
ncbi:hypothetical protein AB0C02_25530 [Micromonospora sp. NPDC048999]|uniref:hypothetical protein n=1 Tax=Micromonospora sp. NPDC048999 TaxID=3155391 RepID=UPI00340E5216